MKEIRKSFARNIGELIIGRKLSHSLKKLDLSVNNGAYDKGAIYDVTAAIFYRFTRISLVLIVFTSMPIILSYMNYKQGLRQNKLIEIQNKTLEQQSILIDSQRQNNLTQLLANTINNIHHEMTQYSKLSEELISQIVALSQILL